jgi:hypothetical protein
MQWQLPAIRDLSHARQAAKKDQQGKRQQISGASPHMNWLMAQKLAHREQRTAFRRTS